MTRTRDGFVLLSVLWVLVSIAALALIASIAGRGAHAGSRNRANLTVAYWKAADCAERVRSAIDLALSASVSLQESREASAWQHLDRAVAPSRLLDGCHVALTPVGATWDINTLSPHQLRLLLVNLGLSSSADSLVDAFFDWCDADDVPRPLGAERAEYEARSTIPPRNGPLTSMAELRRIRGFGSLGGLDSVLGVEPGLLAIEHASLNTLALLAGLDAEAVRQIGEMRASKLPLRDLTQLSQRLSAASRASLQAATMERALQMSLEPKGWVLVSREYSGVPEVEATIEVRLQRSGDRIAVVRRRETR